MKKIMLIIAIALFIYSCSEESTSPNKPSATIDDLIKNAGELSPQPQSFTKISIGTKEEKTDDNGVSYKSKSNVFKMSNKFDEIVAFNSMYADVLYPGAIIQGKDLMDGGKLTSIGDFKRRPITITLSQGSSTTVNNPTLSTVTNGIKEILSKNDITPGQMTYTKTELFDSDQAFLSLGLDINWLPAQFASKFQKNSGIKKKSIFLFFKQIYYTISTNSFSKSSDYFDSTVTVEQLQTKIYKDNPACYISSVNYGRIIIVKMTSEESYSNMISSLEGSYTIVNGKAQFDKSKLKISSTFDAIIVGGSASGAANALASGGIDEINQLIINEAKPTLQNPGFPISFTVRYLNTGSPVKLGKTTEYVEQNWEVDKSNYQRFRLSNLSFRIDNDCDFGTAGGGDFVYAISILDNNGDNIKLNGKDSITQKGIYEVVSSGGQITINEVFEFEFPKDKDYTFRLKGFLRDWDDEIGLDYQEMGVIDEGFTYPWSSINGETKNVSLDKSSACNGYFFFKLEKIQ